MAPCALHLAEGLNFSFHLFAFLFKVSLSCFLHEVGKKEQAVWSKGQFADHGDKRMLGGTPQASPLPQKYKRKPTSGSRAGRGLARQLAVPVFRVYPVISLLSCLSCHLESVFSPSSSYLRLGSFFLSQQCTPHGLVPGALDGGPCWEPEAWGVACGSLFGRSEACCPALSRGAFGIFG